MKFVSFAKTKPMAKVPITVVYGDGIGPEIMEAVMFILQEAGAEIEPERVEMGEKIYLQGNTTGIPPEAWESIHRTKVILKAPITTPQGGGYKSLNVTLRKTLGLFANVRPAVTYHPFIETKYPGMDVVIVRENEEDLYAGIEYQVSPDVYHAVKLISVPGSEKVIRYAFEYAVKYGRKKVTCMTKDNILKMTDGAFHKIFDRIAQDYPQIEAEHWIVDIGTAKLADTPEKFDVVVMPNLYGDVASDMTAQISGSVGLGGGANIGTEYAMFEAIHGSAPRRAGQGIANPSGLLFGAIMMLVHIGQPEVAERIHNAWMKTIEDGYHTYDIYREGVSKVKVGTMDFARALVERLGQEPQHLQPKRYGSAKPFDKRLFETKPITDQKMELIGVDVFISEHTTANKLAKKLETLHSYQSLRLKSIANRGIQIWPQGDENTFCTDSWRLRFLSDQPISQSLIADLLHQLNQLNCIITGTCSLYNVNGKQAFTLAQGE